MASLIEILLGADTKIIKEMPKATVKIERLSNLLDVDFALEIRGLTQRELMNLPDGGTEALNQKLILGITNIDFANGKLCEKFTPDDRKTPLTPPEVLDVLFLPGEKVSIAKLINELSGFGENAIEKIEKN